MTDRVKTSLFDSLNPYLRDALVLDLFAGVGGLGIEALSRGAAHCTFVERDHLCVEALQTNLRKTRLSDRATVYERDVETALALMRSEVSPVNIVLFDPRFRWVNLRRGPHWKRWWKGWRTDSSNGEVFWYTTTTTKPREDSRPVASASLTPENTVEIALRS